MHDSSYPAPVQEAVAAVGQGAEMTDVSLAKVHSNIALCLNKASRAPEAIEAAFE
jgi:hypothetical protein